MAHAFFGLVVGAIANLASVWLILVSAWQAFVQYGKAAGSTSDAGESTANETLVDDPGNTGGATTTVMTVDDSGAIDETATDGIPLSDTEGTGTSELERPTGSVPPPDTEVTTTPSVTPNDAVPDDPLTRQLPSTGTKRPYQELVREWLRDYGKIIAIIGLLLLWYGPEATVGPVFPMPTDHRSLILVGGGVALGVGLSLGGGLLTVLLDRFGLYHGTPALTERLMPESRRETLVHFLVLLPAIALAEELWFRALLVGIGHGAFGAPLWLVVPFSAVVFGMLHREQGRTAVLTTGLSGSAFALAFVATGSLLVPIIAHYVLNVVTFLHVRS